MNGLPGFRFYPTEQELVLFYLGNKLQNMRPDMERFIPVVDVYSYDPTELPQVSGEASVQDPEQWFFFCPRQEKEVHGGRPTRTTRSGYWKATGSPSQVFHDNRVVGKKKTMVFYEGRAPKGRKTSWKMNEYRAYEEPFTSGETLKLRCEFSLCRVYKRTGCLRSFDRRPNVENGNNVRRSISAAGTSSKCHGYAAITMAERELSQVSSPSDEMFPVWEAGANWELEEEYWGSLVGSDENLM